MNYEKHVITYKAILDDIERLTNRLDEIETQIKEYRDSIDLVGKTSELGLALKKEISVLSGERNQIPPRINELKSKASMFEDLVDNIAELSDELTSSKEETIEETSNEVEEDIKEDESKDVNDSNVIYLGKDESIITDSIVQDEKIEEKEEVVEENIIEDDINDTILETSNQNIEEEIEEKPFNIPDFILNANKESEEIVNEEVILENKIADDISESYYDQDDITEEFYEQEEIVNEPVQSESTYYEERASFIATYDNDTDKMLDVVDINGEKDIKSNILSLYQQYGNNISFIIGYDAYNEQGEFVARAVNLKDYDDLNNKVINDDITIEKENTKSSIKIPDFILNNNVKENEIKQEVKKEEKVKEKVKTKVENEEKANTENKINDEKIQNVKIEYRNHNSYYYKIDYDVNVDGRLVHKTKKAKRRLSRTLMNNRKARDLIAKQYGLDKHSMLYKKLDLNVVERLQCIDKEYNTNYAYEYIKGDMDININYNIKDILNDKVLKFKDKFKMLQVAYYQSLLANTTYEYPKTIRYIQKASVACAMGIALLLGAKGVKDVKSTFNTTKVEDKKTETNVASSIVKYDNSIMEDVVKQTEEILNTEASTTTETTSKKDDTTIGLQEKLALIQKDEDGNLKNTYVLNKELNGEGDKILASTYSDCDVFKISQIVAYKDDEVLETVKNGDTSTKDLYEKYGDDIDIEFNFDGYKKDSDTPLYTNIGWLKLDNFKPKDMVSLDGSDDLSVYASVDKTEYQYESKKTESQASNTTESTEEKTTTVASNNESKTSTTSTSNKKTTTVASNEEKNSTVSSEDSYKFGLNGKITLAFDDGKGNVVSSQTLTGDAWGNGKEVNAGKLKCDYFKIRYIAAYSGKLPLDTIKVSDGDDVDALVTSLYKEYGADIDISFNFDGYKDDKDEPLYTVIGWLDINKIVNISDEEKQAIANNSNSSAKTMVLSKK